MSSGRATRFRGVMSAIMAFCSSGNQDVASVRGKAGGNYVDAYAERSNLFRKRADEGIKARFCSGVGNETR